MIKIPMDSLSQEALQGVIDAFVLREGTDYGHREISLEEKRARVTKLLEADRAFICFYPENEHIDIQLVDS